MGSTNAMKCKVETMLEEEKSKLLEYFDKKIE